MSDVTNNTDLMNFQASITVVGEPIALQSCTEPFACCALQYFLELESQSPGNYNQFAKSELCRMFVMAWGINNSAHNEHYNDVVANCEAAFNARYPDA